MLQYFRSKKIVPLQTKELLVFEDVIKLSSVMKFFGLFPLVLEKDKFQLSSNLLLISIAILLSTVIIETYTVNQINLSLTVQLYRFIAPFQHFFVGTANLTILFFFSKISLLNKTLRNIFIVDRFLKELEKISVRHTEKKYTVMLIFFISFTYAIRVSFVGSLEYAGKLFFIYWPSVFVTFYLQQICSILSILHARFGSLVECLQDCCRAQDSRTKRTLENLTKCHHALCRAGSYLNDLFSLSFLALAADGFIMFVCELYSVYIITMESGGLTFALVKCCWCSLGFLIFWQLCYECETTSRKVISNFTLHVYFINPESIVFMHSAGNR